MTSDCRRYQTLALLAPALMLLPSFCQAQDDTKPKRRAAYKYYQLDLHQRSILSGEPVMTDAEAARFQRTLAVLIKSPRVLESALRPGKLRDVDFLPRDHRAVVWLQEHLEVSSPTGSGVLMLSLPHDTANREEMKKVVTAVSRAFLDEVIFEEKLRSKKPRDILAESYQDLDEEIRRKTNALYAILDDTRSTQLAKVGVQVELMKEQLARLEAQKLEAQRWLLERRVSIRTSEKNVASQQEALAVLEDEFAGFLDGLESEIKRLNESLLELNHDDADINDRHAEIEVLRNVQTAIAERIEQWDIELRRPELVRPFGGVNFFDPDETREQALERIKSLRAA